MQFYILNSNPETSVKLLPDYALKRVNLREGWQIISDIGHINNVRWENQNKLYSASHALTRSLNTKTEFYEFIEHYKACLIEYKKRFMKETKFHEWFNNAVEILKKLSQKLPKNVYESRVDYLLKYKTKFLSQEEIEKLMEMKLKKGIKTMSDITYWQNIYKEYTPDSIQRAYDAMIKERGKADAIITNAVTMDYFVRAEHLSGLGYGKLKKGYKYCNNCGLPTNKGENHICGYNE